MQAIRELCWRRRTISIAAVAPVVVDKYVRADPKISGPALKRVLKKCAIDSSNRSVNLPKRSMTLQAKRHEEKAYALLKPFCSLVEE